MVIEQIRKRWEQLKHMQPSHPEEDPKDCEMAALNFAAEHFDTLLAEIEKQGSVPEPGLTAHADELEEE